ncbi:MAG: DUF1707 SHOCT-like domain-containing protein [Acidimicrobiales bacterium]
MGSSRSDQEPPGPADALVPRPVPELPGRASGGPGAGGPVTDDDRQRFGVLLDRAFERGLLDPVEYQYRLGAIAAATSLDELRDLVTELPALRTAAGRAPGDGTGFGGGYGAPGVEHQAWLASLGRPRYGATSGPRRSPWPVLVVVLAILALLMVVLAVVGAHLARSHPQGLARSPSPVVVVERPMVVGRVAPSPAAVSPSRL